MRACRYPFWTVVAFNPLAWPLAAAYASRCRPRRARRTTVRWEACTWEPSKDIVDTAVDDGSFRTLVRALLAAELDSVLKGDGPFTVFAPNDAAFDKLGSKEVDNLLRPKNREKLKEILTYHVVPDRLTRAALTGRSSVVRSLSVESVDGRELTVSVSGDQVKVNGAKVVKADVACSNGIIHVIDTVLLPPDED